MPTLECSGFGQLGADKSIWLLDFRLRVRLAVFYVVEMEKIALESSRIYLGGLSVGEG